MSVSNTARQNAVEIQRDYYARTAGRYDEIHLDESGEHYFAVAVHDLDGRLSGDRVDSGRGRRYGPVSHRRGKRNSGDKSRRGWNRRRSLREIGYSKGLLESQLIDGDAMNLPFPDNSFDLVCEFSALHAFLCLPRRCRRCCGYQHRRQFSSPTSTTSGQGSRFSRLVKQAVNAAGLWRLADFIKTKGKGYILSEGDGLSYSYSVFNNYGLIREQCEAVHMLNTTDGAPDLYRSASHVALLGIKRQVETATAERS